MSSRVIHRTTCVQPASGPVAVASALEWNFASIRNHHVANAFSECGPAGFELGDHSFVGSARLDESSLQRSRSGARSCWPSSSSTPDVPPAITSLVCRSSTARCDASVSALTLRSWPWRVAPKHATTGTYPRSKEVREQPRRAIVDGRSNKPEIDFGPCDTGHRAARVARSRPMRRRRSVPRDWPPRARSAATRRVLMAPASTETTTSRVRASVTRRPSICCLGIPAAARAESISRPPPWTITRAECLARAAIPVARRRSSSAVLEQLAAELQDPTGSGIRCGTGAERQASDLGSRIRPFTSGPSARRGRA